MAMQSHAADLQAGGTLKVIAQLRAGQPALTVVVQPGEAVEIMTGAPMPGGADSVLMVEHADLLHDCIHPQAGPLTQSRRQRGFRPARKPIPGTSSSRQARALAAMHIGAAVSCGAALVDVHRQPRIAILATGDELVEPGEPVRDFQIRNSNSYSLAAQVERSGGIPVRPADCARHPQRSRAFAQSRHGE